MKKPTHPGKWTNTASGHVDAGKTYEVSAERELAEEIGITTPLTFIGKFLIRQNESDKRINQFSAVFEGHITHDTALTLEPAEVSEVRWFTLQELRSKIARSSEKFTPALVKTIEKFYTEKRS
jgi:isopentenyldiphosphate isomerase